jgi:hypothetical protein
MEKLELTTEEFREMVEGGMKNPLPLLFARKRLLSEIIIKYKDDDEEALREDYDFQTVRGADLYFRDLLGLDIKVLKESGNHHQIHMSIEIHNIHEDLMPLFMYQHWAFEYGSDVIDDFQTIINQIVEIYGFEGTWEEDILMEASFWMDNDELGRWYATFDHGC